jgi:competence protein ComEA
MPAVPPGVDLNAASAADLQKIPGIGPKAAEAIVAHREEQGPFTSIDDLAAIRGFGPAKVEQLRSFLRV